MKHSFPLHRKLFVSHFLTALVVASTLGVFVYLMARESILDQLKLRLGSSASLISHEIDANELRDIRYPSDANKYEYREALDSLRQMIRSSGDISFVYIMRKTVDDEIVFVVDSDDSEEQAQPGDVYEAATPELKRGFLERSADSELTTDKWGSFFSGYAPLLNGNGEFLVGLDMRADDAYEKLYRIRMAAVFGLIFTLIFSWIIASWLSRHFRKPIDAMVEQIQAVGSGNLDRKLDIRRDDEMATLLAAINDMTSDLKQARDNNLRLAESLGDSFPDDGDDDS